MSKTLPCKFVELIEQLRKLEVAGVHPKHCIFGTSYDVEASAVQVCVTRFMRLELLAF